MRALIVEDEAALASYLGAALEHDGLIVDVAQDGDAALDMLLTRPYDVVTLDVMLPGLNGYEVCRQARAAGVGTPILMLTAKSGEYDEADAFEMGADDFLRKPFSLVVLLARVRSLLRRGGSSFGEKLQVGDVTLDPRRHEVHCSGQEVLLTAREFSLLERLMRRAGEVCSKADLLDYVWGSDYLGGENVVEVYVSYLRKKVDVPFGTEHIQTVRGAGYRMV